MITLQMRQLETINSSTSVVATVVVKTMSDCSRDDNGISKDTLPMTADSPNAPNAIKELIESKEWALQEFKDQ